MIIDKIPKKRYNKGTSRGKKTTQTRREVWHLKKNRGNFPLLQRIWSGDMNVANEVYVLLPIYFRSSLMDKSISSKGICWIPSLWILFIPRNPFAASNGDWLLRDNRGAELMCDARSTVFLRQTCKGGAVFTGSADDSVHFHDGCLHREEFSHPLQT